MTANTVNNFPLRPMKTPFAGTALISANTSSVGGINVSTLPATGDNVANVATGFPETFSTSITKGGKYIKRADVNAMGYIATIMAFRQQMGMPNEWNKQICDAIGGYPKGAVLDYCIWNGSVIQETYKITSLTDDNTEDPTTTAQAKWTKWARVSVNAESVSSSTPKVGRFVTGAAYTWESFSRGGLTSRQDVYTTKNDCYLFCGVYGTHDNYGYYGFVNGSEIFRVAGDNGTDNHHSFRVPVKAGAKIGFQTGANVTIQFTFIEYQLS